MALVTVDELAAALDRPGTADNSDLQQACDAASAVVEHMLDPALAPHDEHAYDREAALAVAVQIWSSRKAPGGTMQAVDFQPVIIPHLLGPGLIARINGLIRVCRKYGGLVVG